MQIEFDWTTRATHHAAVCEEDRFSLLGSLTEIQAQSSEDRSLALVLPALAKLSQEHRWLAWIAPPDSPTRPAVGLCRCRFVTRAGGLSPRLCG